MNKIRVNKDYYSITKYNNALGKALGNGLGRGTVFRNNLKISFFLFEIEFEAQKVLRKLPFKGINFLYLL